MNTLMEPSYLTSVDDARLDPFRAIKGKGDRGDGTFVAESELVLDRLLESSFNVRSILITPPRAERLSDQIGAAHELRDLRREPFEVLVASREIIDAVVGYPLHRGVITLAERKPLTPLANVLAQARTVVVMEDIADPDNIGAIFRHAAGFGVDAVILTGHTADPLYRRTIRISMGWTLAIPYARVATGNGPITALLHNAGFTTFGLTPSADLTLQDATNALDATARVAFLVGAEGPGLKPETMDACTRKVRIPMASGVDSFNVATSVAIGLFALTSAQPARLVRTPIS
jgi:tRNA G18 (ribose-2'-O)-methylase SpoU